MAAYPRRIYWDACAWIALIQDEKILGPESVLIEDRGALCRSVIALANKQKIEIITSALSLAEVCKSSKLREEQSNDKLEDFFQNEFILLVSIDRSVGSKARALMLSGYPKLKPPDAVHLASALVANADEFHTFDDALLKLDRQINKLDGTKLKICRPAFGGPHLPLLDNDSRH